MEEVIKMIHLLDDDDKSSLAEFVKLLLKKDKYKLLRKEIDSRRSEIARGDVLTHRDLWQDVQTNV